MLKDVTSSVFVDSEQRNFKDAGVGSSTLSKICVLWFTPGAVESSTSLSGLPAERAMLSCPIARPFVHLCLVLGKSVPKSSTKPCFKSTATRACVVCGYVSAKLQMPSHSSHVWSGSVGGFSRKTPENGIGSKHPVDTPLASSLGRNWPGMLHDFASFCRSPILKG